ncbi:MAG: hypothetical protein GF372_05505 [Candidatus Marinimicrobia bacterium]|nr:hypothetical protein [Candidatus Neomarinimicrobiota bacterium]
MVGISFLGKKVLFAQHRDENGEEILQIVGQIELSSFPDLEYIRRSDFRLDMVELFGKIKNVVRFPDRQSASLSIPSNWLHYYLINLEPGLDTEMKREFLTWEFHQRIGSTGESLKPKFYRIQSTDEKEQVLTVGVPAELLDIFVEVADRVHFTLKIVDIDILSALRALPELDKKQFVCKYTSQTITITEAYDGDIAAVAQFLRKSDDMLQYSRGTTNDKYARILQDKLERLNNPDKSVDEPFWVYGNAVPTSVQSRVQSSEKINIIHPFYGFNVLSGAAKSMSLLEACEFSEVTGVIRQGKQNLA